MCLVFTLKCLSPKKPIIHHHGVFLHLKNTGHFNKSHDPFVFSSRNNFEFLIFLHRELTKVPHMATTAGDEQTVQFMLKRWQDADSGLDQAWREEYLVYLSFPDPKNPNKVTVGESTGC